MGTYTNVTNRESPYSWAYKLAELSDNSFLPGNAAVYEKAMREGYPQVEGMPFSYPALDPRKNSAWVSSDNRLSKAAIALSDIYDTHQPFMRLSIPKDYFQKATNFLQNFEEGALASDITPSTRTVIPAHTVRDLGFNGKNQLQDIADLAEILYILDRFGENNVKNQIEEVTKSPGFFSGSPISSKDRLRWADLYKTVSPALRQPNRDYSVVKPYLTPTGYKDLMNTVGKTYNDSLKNWIKLATPTESSQNVTQALKGIKSSDAAIPLNPEDDNPVIAVMKQLGGE